MTALIPPTTTLADVLLMHGIDGTLTPPLRTYSAPVAPVCGRVITVQMAPGGVEGGFDPLYDLLSSDLSGAVIVVAGMNGIPGSMWGQILSRAAARRGALGTVVDGAVRDVSLLDGEGLPVWAASEHTAGAPGQAHVSGIRATVRVANMAIDSGDLLVGDAAGAVRIPQANAELVLSHARVLAEAEDRLLDDLAAGRRLAEAYLHKRTAQAAIRADLQSNGTVANQAH